MKDNAFSCICNGKEITMHIWILVPIAITFYDAVFDRLESLFDQLANPKSDKAALLKAIQAFQAELAAMPSANEAEKPASTAETPVATETPVEKEAAASEGSKPATTETETEPASAAVTEASTPDAPSPQNQ